MYMHSTLPAQALSLTPLLLFLNLSQRVSNVLSRAEADDAEPHMLYMMLTSLAHGEYAPQSSCSVLTQPPPQLTIS